jgi:hypothetical protein
VWQNGRRGAAVDHLEWSRPKRRVLRSVVAVLRPR